MILKLFIICLISFGGLNAHSISNPGHNVMMNVQHAFTVPEVARKFGYPCEEHKITTPDGYILKIHRIPMGVNEEETNVNENKPVVLLEHGAYASSLSWLLNPTPENCLPLSLADKGFDVWLGNTRGSVYGNSHVSLNPTSDEFWNFTLDEIAKYDIPATIDYVYKFTKRPVKVKSLEGVMRVSIPRDETYEGLRSHYPEFSNQGIFTTQSQIGGQREQGESTQSSMERLMEKIGSTVSQLNPFSSETAQPSKKEQKQGKKAHTGKQMGGMTTQSMHGQYQKEKFEEQPSFKTKSGMQKQRGMISTESHLDTLTEQKLKRISGKGGMGGIHGGSSKISGHEQGLKSLNPEEEEGKFDKEEEEERISSLKQKPSWLSERTSKMEPIEMSEEDQESLELGSDRMSDVSTEHMADRDINRYNPESPTLRQRSRRSPVSSREHDISQSKRQKIPSYMNIEEEEEELEPSLTGKGIEEEERKVIEEGEEELEPSFRRNELENEEEECGGQMRSDIKSHMRHGSRYRRSLSPRKRIEEEEEESSFGGRNLEEESEEEEEEEEPSFGGRHLQEEEEEKEEEEFGNMSSDHMGGIQASHMQMEPHQTRKTRLRRSSSNSVKGDREQFEGSSSLGLEKFENILKKGKHSQSGHKQHEIKSWKTSQKAEVDENAIFYIGFAQNSLTGLMALSENPSLAEKIKLFIGIGTIGTGQYANTPLMKLLKTVNLDDIFSQEMIFMNPDERLKMAQALCTNKVDLANVVFGEPEDVFYFFGGENKHVDRKNIPFYLQNLMAGTSKNTMKHFGQIVSNNRIQTFDKNVLSRTGSKLMSLLTPTTTQMPSEYDLHNVVVPVALFAGEIDAASPPKDNEFFVRTLPNVVDYEVIKGYGHYDFLLGNNCQSAYIEKIIDLLQE